MEGHVPIFFITALLPQPHPRLNRQVNPPKEELLEEQPPSYRASSRRLGPAERPPEEKYNLTPKARQYLVTMCTAQHQLNN